MLRACRRVLRPGGLIAFTTILPTPGLPAPARRRANRVGVAVAVPTSYPSLLRSAGFTAIDEIDVSADYRATLMRWMAATDRHEDALRAATGDAFFDDRVASRRRSLAAVDAGLHQRRLYTAVR